MKIELKKEKKPTLTSDKLYSDSLVPQKALDYNTFQKKKMI